MPFGNCHTHLWGSPPQTPDQGRCPRTPAGGHYPPDPRGLCFLSCPIGTGVLRKTRGCRELVPCQSPETESLVGSGAKPQRVWRVTAKRSIGLVRLRNSEFGWVGGRGVGPIPSGSSTAAAERPRLHLNAFRGEPASSGLDWHFTSTHRSSHGIAAPTGPGLRPVHG